MTEADKKHYTFTAIMAFYVFLAHILFPSIYYYYIERSYKSAGTGFVVGSLVSIVLWYSIGSKMIWDYYKNRSKDETT